MANKEHLKLLKKGIECWNSWREKNLEIQIDLSKASLSRADLNRADLREIDLRGSDLKHANLSESDLSRANLCYADLRGADLRGADLKRADLSNATLIEANLYRANLSEANLYRANLIEADLKHANFKGADLNRANFSEADLSEANLSETNLYKVNFSEADLSMAIIGWTNFGEQDLRGVKGLETVRHRGPSYLSINTIYASKGNLPRPFIRGTGAPDDFIEYMHILANKLPEYHSCFISYSSKDQDFANRLYTDLQDHNVRCWFASEDMKIGDKIRSSIDKSILLHDKLLLILSEHSVTSTWVEKEVETAFEREREEDKSILCPIKLDEAIKQTKSAWAADVRRMRHIGDFNNWKQSEQYQRAFKRLLRDLKVDEKKQDQQSS